MTTKRIESSHRASQWTMTRYACTAAACGLPSWVRAVPERSAKYCPYCGEPIAQEISR